MIEVHDISKRFGAVQALDRVSLHAPDGHITGLLGPNGAGKSTTLRIISTVLKPDTGQVRIDRVDPRWQPLEARRRLGVLPHASGLYPRLSARENIRYYGRLNGLGGSELKQRITGLIDMLEIGAFAERKAGGFSQGQRIKVALARALVHGPKNLVLDEPTNGLDVMATRALRSLLRHLKNEGHCILLSSHIMQEVAALCDEIVIVARGSVVAQGSADAIRAQTGHSDLEEAFVAAVGNEGLT